MKLNTTLTISTLALGLLARLGGQEAASATAPAAAPAVAAPSFSQDQALEVFGWYIGKSNGLAELEFTAADLEPIFKGIRLAQEGKESPYALEAIGPEIDKMMRARQERYMAKRKVKQDEAAAKLMESLAANPKIVSLPSGLKYEIVQDGNGEFPAATDTVKVHYTGTLVDGTKFDSSYDSGAPADISLNQVIPGWTEGLQKVSKGGKIKLYIPAALAYGDMDRPGIPGGSTLLFDVELLDIVKAPAMPEAPAAPAAPTEAK